MEALRDTYSDSESSGDADAVSVPAATTAKNESISSDDDAEKPVEQWAQMQEHTQRGGIVGMADMLSVMKNVQSSAAVLADNISGSMDANADMNVTALALGCVGAKDGGTANSAVKAYARTAGVHAAARLARSTSTSDVTTSLFPDPRNGGKFGPVALRKILATSLLFDDTPGNAWRKAARTAIQASATGCHLVITERAANKKANSVEVVYTPSPMKDLVSADGCFRARMAFSMAEALRGMGTPNVHEDVHFVAYDRTIFSWIRPSVNIVEFTRNGYAILQSMRAMAKMKLVSDAVKREEESTYEPGNTTNSVYTATMHSHDAAQGAVCFAEVSLQSDNVPGLLSGVVRAACLCAVPPSSLPPPALPPPALLP